MWEPGRHGRNVGCEKLCSVFWHLLGWYLYHINNHIEMHSVLFFLLNTADGWFPLTDYSSFSLSLWHCYQIFSFSFEVFGKKHLFRHKRCQKSKVKQQTGGFSINQEPERYFKFQCTSEFHFSTSLAEILIIIQVAWLNVCGIFLV